ncbi:hypothetical protein ACFPM3_12295 [Streptomyces coeruleoprunus]|uniref:Lipoprotein n=1 Tax=Streptomyces coeruleoprunus TaxID=285563 RepID=A0ABV9XH75_9ACTN
MRTLTRRLLVPTLIPLALVASGCSTSAPAGTPPAGAATAPTAPAVTPAAEARESERLEVAPAPRDTPTAVARPATEGGTDTRKSTLKVAEYDSRTRRAVISTPQDPSRRPSPEPSTAEPSAAQPTAAAAGAPVRTGDIIASAPAPGAPEGLLVEVTKVVRTTDKGTEVATKPATLGALLADDKADGEIPVDPSTVDVEPLVKGVKFSWAKPDGVRFGPNGAQVPAGRLRLDVGTSLETAADAPVSAAASVSGHVQLAPQVEFSYDGSAHGQAGRPGPGSAFLGMSGEWSAEWAVKGRAAARTSQRIPLAKLHADPVIQVGPVPVVVNLDLTVYLQVEADGRITLDVRQDVKGDFRVGGGYTPGKGWAPVSTSDVKSTPVTATVTAAGRARTALGAEASVGLYGMVGVTADFAPYLRAEGEVKATASSSGAATVTGSWALHGGFDLSGNLQLQLSVFGTPLLQKRIPLGTLHREWPLAAGKGQLSA